MLNAVITPCGLLIFVATISRWCCLFSRKRTRNAGNWWDVLRHRNGKRQYFREERLIEV